MDDASTTGVTNLLGALSGGSDDAFGVLVEAVYDDLHAIASDRLRKKYGNRLNAMTISPTVLANDATMALLRQRNEWQNSEQFFAIATRLMLRLITDYQRQRLAAKRGGGKRGVPFEEGVHPADTPEAGEIDEAGGSIISAIQRLHEEHPRKAEVVTLHVMGGHPLPRVAKMLSVSTPTVERDWRFARAWLTSELKEDE